MPTGIYERQTAPLMVRLAGRTERRGDCWCWVGDSVADGYGRIQTSTGKALTHRAAYEAFVGPIPPKTLVLHHCDNPPCWNPAHLFLGTAAENMEDMRRKGRQPKRDQQAERTRAQMQQQARLTDVVADAIRRERAEKGTPQAELARRFSVSQMTISRLLRNDPRVKIRSTK